MAKKKDEQKAEKLAFWAKNAVLKDQKLPEERVTAQLAVAPAPQDKGKSGYPHKFADRENIIERSPGSFGSLYEYPATQTGPAYNFDSKPKDNPGPFRFITNNQKKFKGVIAHNGDAKTQNPNAGFFHSCEKR